MDEANERSIRNEANIGNLDKRMDRVEKKLDSVDSKVDNIISNELKHVKQDRKFWLKMGGYIATIATAVGTILIWTFKILAFI